eukprot:3343002-Pyramimonas_sp.AAC.2
MTPQYLSCSNQSRTDTRHKASQFVIETHGTHLVGTCASNLAVYTQTSAQTPRGIAWYLKISTGRPCVDDGTRLLVEVLDPERSPVYQRQSMKGLHIAALRVHPSSASASR